jgi:hypothetical protein
MEKELKILEPKLLYAETIYSVIILHDGIEYDWVATRVNDSVREIKYTTQIRAINGKRLKNSIKKSMKKMVLEVLEGMP